MKKRIFVFILFCVFTVSAITILSNYIFPSTHCNCSPVDELGWLSFFYLGADEFQYYRIDSRECTSHNICTSTYTVVCRRYITSTNFYDYGVYAERDTWCPQCDGYLDPWDPWSPYVPKGVDGEPMWD